MKSLGLDSLLLTNLDKDSLLSLIGVHKVLFKSITNLILIWHHYIVWFCYFHMNLHIHVLKQSNLHKFSTLILLVLPFPIWKSSKVRHRMSICCLPWRPSVPLNTITGSNETLYWLQGFIKVTTMQLPEGCKVLPRQQTSIDSQLSRLSTLG